jgi:hypothetical protein
MTLGTSAKDLARCDYDVEKYLHKNSLRLGEQYPIAFSAIKRILDETRVPEMRPDAKILLL